MVKRYCAVLLLALIISITSGAAFAVDMGTIYVGYDFSGTDDINIETFADTYTNFVGHAFGIYVNGGTDTTETKAGNNLTITTHGVAADGIRTNPSGITNWQNARGIIRVGNGLTIDTYGQSADGINLNGNNKLYIGNGATISTYYTGTLVHTDGVTGEGAHAVRANFNAEIYIGDGLIASTLGQSSHTIYSAAGRSLSQPNGSKIFIGDGLRATTAGDASYGAYVDSRNGIIAISDDARLSTAGERAHAAYVNSNTGKISFGEDAVLLTGGSDSYAAYAATANSKISFGENAFLQTDGSGSHGVYVNNNTANVEFLGGASIITSEDSSCAIYADRGSVTSNLGGGLNAVSGGLFTVSGDMVAVNGSIDLIMTEGSLFTGKTDVGSGNISLNTRSTLWNVTGDSTLTNLVLDGSIVNFLDTPTGTTVTVENLGSNSSDRGLFRMNTDIVQEFADMLIITGSAVGSYLIDVQNDGGAQTSGNELTDLVRVSAGQDAIFELDHEVELGGWLYELAIPDRDVITRAHTDDTWYLRSTGRASDPADAAINTFSAAYLLSYAETDTLIQRMGDLRAAPYMSGLWFRAHGGKFESNAKSFVRSFDMDYGGIHIGWDRKYETDGDGSLYAGVMFGYSKGELEYFHGGKGDVDSKMLGVYGTFIKPDGFYMDTIIKYQWMNNEFDVLDSASARVTGSDVSTGGFGASIELGQRIPFGQAQKSGWYAEPQVQLSYMRQDGGYFKASNGLQIGVEPFTSLLGRLGILVGYEKEHRNFYAKVSRVKEFDGDVTVYANGMPVGESFGGSWWVYGLGFTARINDRNSLYLDIERASGGCFTQPWSARLGWRTELR